jgi:hypothetical protein
VAKRAALYLRKLVNYASGDPSELAARFGIPAAKLICPHVDDQELHHINSFKKGVESGLIPAQDVCTAGNDRHDPTYTLNSPADLPSVDALLTDFVDLILAN